MKIFKIKAQRIHAPADSTATTVEYVPEFMVQADTIGEAAENAILVLGKNYFKLHFENIEECK